MIRTAALALLISAISLSHAEISAVQPLASQSHLNQVQKVDETQSALHSFKQWLASFFGNRNRSAGSEDTKGLATLGVGIVAGIVLLVHKTAQNKQVRDLEFRLESSGSKLDVAEAKCVNLEKQKQQLEQSLEQALHTPHGTKEPCSAGCSAHSSQDVTTDTEGYTGSTQSSSSGAAHHDEPIAQVIEKYGANSSARSFPVPINSPMPTTTSEVEPLNLDVSPSTSDHEENISTPHAQKTIHPVHAQMAQEVQAASSSGSGSVATPYDSAMYLKTGFQHPVTPEGQVGSVATPASYASSSLAQELQETSDASAGTSGGRRWHRPETTPDTEKDEKITGLNTQVEKLKEQLAALQKKYKQLQHMSVQPGWVNLEDKLREAETKIQRLEPELSMYQTKNKELEHKLERYDKDQILFRKIAEERDAIKKDNIEIAEEKEKLKKENNQLAENISQSARHGLALLTQKAELEEKLKEASEQNLKYAEQLEGAKAEIARSEEMLKQAPQAEKVWESNP